MFLQAGWQAFKEDVEAIRSDYVENSTHVCDTNDKWQYRRGQLDILSYLVGYEDTMKAAYDEMMQQEETLDE